MCAIAGVISKNRKISDNEIRDLQKILNHRGPDSTDYYMNNEVFLLHNRLSIIDLDKRSNQPMFDEKKNICIVFNGEIYNYLELKKKLSEKYKFKTKSDTEVLLAAYIIWGEKMLHQLSGAFAFCIYNIKEKTVFIARDRFGQKPLYFLNNLNSFIFSSEIKGIISLGYKPEPNYLAWRSYLLDGSTDDTKETFFKNIYQLKPGEKAIFKRGNLQISRWYHLSENINLNDKSNYKKDLLSFLKKSIELNTRADVPVAISLSGGIDSNILMSMCYKHEILKYKPKCFSIYFEDFSEKKLIENSTSKYNFDSTFINFSKNDLINIFEPLTWSLESPSGGLMNCGLAKLSNIVSKEKIKILLDGTGLDEGFGGYELHHLQYLMSLKNTDNNQFNRHMNLFVKNWGISEEKVNKKLKNLESSNAKTIDGHSLTNRTVLSENLNQLIDDREIKKNETNVYNDKVKSSLVDYIQNTKIPRNNRLKDRISMAQSVELRLPFLEHELLEYALSLDTKSYFLNGKSKSILRHVTKDYLDQRVRLNKKISIQSPQSEWLRSEKIKIFIEDNIFSKKFKERGIFNYKNVEKEWKNFLKGNFDTSFFIWQIISTEIWFNVFMDKNIKDVKKDYIFE